MASLEKFFREKSSGDLLAVAVLLFMVLWFCQDLLFNGGVPFFRDLTNYFYPLRYSLYESYRAGQLPLWDRHFAQGFPNLAAFQSGAFYPPHLVFILLPFFDAVRALFVVHFAIAAIGTYLLLRSWNYSRDLALVGALLFSLGGVIVSLTNLLNHFQSAVWLPWLILAWEQLLLTATWNRFSCFAIVEALQLLAGSPEVFTMSLGLALIDGFRVRLAAAPSISISKIVGFALASSLLMLALIMAQFLPTAELVLESRRGQAIPAAEAFMWSLSPSSLLNLFFLDKEVDLSISTGLRLFFARDVPFLTSTYLGLVSLFGTALWGYYASRREKLFLSALILFTIALALGGQALIYPFLFRYLPFMSAVRFPEKFFFLTYALMLFLAMRGLKSFVLDQKGATTPLFILGFIALAWIGAYLFLTYHSALVTDFITINSNIPPLSEIHTKATMTVLTNFQRQAILSLGLFFLLFLVKRKKLRPWLFSTLFVSVVFVDLTWAHRGFLFPIHPQQIDKYAPVLRPEKLSLTRFFYYPSPRDLHPAFFSVLGQPTFEQSVALSFQNFLPNVGILHNVDYFQEIDALNRRPYSDFLTVANAMDLERQIRLLRAFNVSHLVSFRELPPKGIQLAGHFPKAYSWLYRVNGAVPRVYVVGRSVVEIKPLEVLRRMTEPDFDPLREVVLDTQFPAHDRVPLSAQATIESYQNSRVMIETHSNADGILVLADSYYPGWKAFVDGKETTISKANYFFRAVALPKGQHRVEFRYEPWTFRLGLLVSAFTLACVLVVSLWNFLKQPARVATTTLTSVEALPN